MSDLFVDRKATAGDLANFVLSSTPDLGDAVGAAASSGWAGTTFNLAREFAGQAEEGPAPGVRYLTPEEQQSSPHWREGFEVSEHMTEETLANRARYRDRDDWNSFILTQRDPGLIEQGLLFGVGMGASLPDPVNLIPFGRLFGMGRWAAAAATRAGAIGRYTAMGAVDATAGNAMLMPLSIYNRDNRGVETGFDDIVYELALSAAVGAPLGAAGGWLASRGMGTSPHAMRDLVREELGLQPLPSVDVSRGTPSQIGTIDPLPGATLAPEGALPPNAPQLIAPREAPDAPFTPAQWTGEQEAPLRASVVLDEFPSLAETRQALVDLEATVQAVLRDEPPPPPRMTSATAPVDPEAAAKWLEERQPTGDAVYDRAVRSVVKGDRASPGWLAGKIRVAPEKAAELIQRMEVEGIVSPANGLGRRQVAVGRTPAARGTMAPEPPAARQANYTPRATFGAPVMAARVTDGFEVQLKQTDELVKKVETQGEDDLVVAEYEAAVAKGLVTPEAQALVHEADMAIEKANAEGIAWMESAACLLRAL